MTRAKPEEQRRREGYPDHRPPRAAVIVGGRITIDDLPGIRPLASMTALERKAWKLLLGPLVAGGVLDRVDLPLLDAAARTLARAWSANRVIRDEGLFGENSQGRVAHPAIAIEKAAWTEFRLQCHMLGISPAARVQLGGEAGIGSLRTPHDGGMAGELGRKLPAAARLRVVGDDGDAD